MPRGKPKASKFIPKDRSERSSEPKHKSNTRSSKAHHPPKGKYADAKPKPGIQELVFETIRSLGEKASVQTLFPIMLSKLTNEQVITSLNRLESQGRIKIINKGKIFIEGTRYASEFEGRSEPRKGDTATGKLDLTKSGAGYVMVEGMDKDIYIPAKFINHAMNGDIVQVRILPGGKGRKEGQITRIVKRARESFMGTLELFDGFALVTPDDSSMRAKFWIAADRLADAKDGDKVIVRVLYWNEKGKHPIAEVEEVINEKRRNDLDMKSILIQCGFHTEFPQDAVAELNKIPDEIPREDFKNRLDMREVLTFTIDPADAKDFDDAISYRLLENGNYEVGVHIADVSHYLVQGSELDKEAERRATSVYLPDRVCPMLPERLSNFLCSLRPNEDKLTFSTIFEFDKTYKIVNTTIAKTVIHSRRRYSYEDAQLVLETGEGDNVEAIKTLDKISKSIRAKRFKNGAIAFEKDEVRFNLDENGKPIGIYLKTRKDAHLMIEDLMLLSNETIAKYGAKLKKGAAKYPFVYRTHNVPDGAKLELFANVARKFGYVLKFDEPRQIADTLNNLLTKVNGKPEQNVLENLAIRSMAKAEYTTKNIGHYGLAMEFYTHFTSPIRRYPDVMVHRLVFEELSGQEHKLTPEEIEEACKNSSLMERKAMEAEREATKYKQVEFLEGKVGEDYDGIITGVTPRGIFVEMVENKCEGMVSLDDMGHEDFMYEENMIRLLGRRSGQTFDLGQKVRVKIKRTSLEERKIDLVLIVE
jgi:ribonuclease R